MTSEASCTKQIYAWAFYDWANSAFATVIMAGFFPLFFRDYWSVGEQSQAITFHLGLANSVASLLIVVSAPVLGAIADRGNAHKRFLFIFASLGVGMTASMVWIAQGQWEFAVVIYVLATIGFMGGNIFYDALIVSVATRSRYDAVSALGFGLGYLGGGLLFSLCVLMSLYPDFFGFKQTTQAVRFSFLMVAIWWAIFSVPIFVTVKGPVLACRHREGVVLGGLHQLRETFRHIRQLRMVGLFLLAYWLYIDGVDTIVRMAIDYGRALGFGREELIVALLITQFVGFPAAIIFGRLGRWLGTKAAIFIALGVYVIATIWGSMMAAPWEFYGLAVTIGLVQGGIQSLSRAYYARLIPVDKTAEFFGFYNMLGKFAAVLGPIMVGWVGILSGNPRIGILSILVLFILGGITLSCVDTS
jgi:UMF1 family MFS transporter